MGLLRSSPATKNKTDVISPLSWPPSQRKWVKEITEIEEKTRAWLSLPAPVWSHSIWHPCCMVHWVPGTRESSSAAVKWMWNQSLESPIKPKVCYYLLLHVLSHTSLEAKIFIPCLPFRVWCNKMIWDKIRAFCHRNGEDNSSPHVPNLLLSFCLCTLLSQKLSLMLTGHTAQRVNSLEKLKT